jgi:hypothetical protein
VKLWCGGKWRKRGNVSAKRERWFNDRLRGLTFWLSGWPVLAAESLRNQDARACQSALRGKKRKPKMTDSQSTLDLVACLFDVRLLRVWLQSRAGLVTERLPLRGTRRWGPRWSVSTRETSRV